MGVVCNSSYNFFVSLKLYQNKLRKREKGDRGDKEKKEQSLPSGSCSLVRKTECEFLKIQK